MQVAGQLHFTNSIFFPHIFFLYASTVPMTTPKNPFRKWLAIPQDNKTRFFLCTFSKTKIHAATMIEKAGSPNICYIKKKFLAAYPQVLSHTGDPSLYSFHSITQWLQNIITLAPEAFTATDTTIASLQSIPVGRPWCFVLFCSNRTKQRISVDLFDSIGFQDGITIKVYHGIRSWNIKIKDGYFEEGWELYCTKNLIHENDMVFLRVKGNLSYDSMAFCTSQSHILMPWTLPLPMLSDITSNIETSGFLFRHQPNSCIITSSINQFLQHDWASFVSFYQFYTRHSKYTLALPQYADLRLHESTTPTVILTSGCKAYCIGMKQRSLDKNWATFAIEHALCPGDILLFIPQSATSFAVIIFNEKGIEKLYPWHFNFTLHLT